MKKGSKLLKGEKEDEDDELDDDDDEYDTVSLEDDWNGYLTRISTQNLKILKEILYYQI